MATNAKKDSNFDLVAEFCKRILSSSRDAVVAVETEIQSLVKRLVEKGQLSPEEGRRLIDEFAGKFRREGLEWREILDTRLQKALAALNIPSRKDVEDLQAKVAELTSRVEELLRIEKEVK